MVMAGMLIMRRYRFDEDILVQYRCEFIIH